MKTFEEVKEELLRRAKEAGACADGYRMGLEAENKADLLKAITKNWRWVLVSARIIDAEYLENNFAEEELNEAGIYVSGIHETSTAAFACDRARVKACGSATVKACGSARVEAFDSARVEAFGSATVKACDSATVKACDSATVKACGSARVEAFDSARVEAFGSARVEAFGSARVKACDRARVEAFGSATVEAFGNSYVEDCTGNIRPTDDFAIVKDYYSHKIYIRKGTFEIIEV